MTTINIERLQGRRYASEVITSILSVSDAFFDHRGALETVRDNLTETAKSRQAEFAAGIMDVLLITSDESMQKRIEAMNECYFKEKQDNLVRIRAERLELTQ